MSLRRRQLLRRSLYGAGALGVAPLWGCTREADALPDPGRPALTKEPYLQHVATGLRLRFETREEVAVPVVLESGGERELTPTLRSADVTYARDFLDASDIFFPDEAGVHVVQEADLGALEPGRYRWRVHADVVHEGEFLVPNPDETVRLGWLADTSWPESQQVVAMLESRMPDVFLHGGDLQYESNPFDTWTGMSQSLAPITQRAVAHMIVGNHEFEEGEEIEQMYDRLYGGQGDGPEGARYFSFRAGAARIICLDSETGGLDDTSDAQVAWFEKELARGDAATTVVAFHRPTYSLSKHYRSDTTFRDIIHSRVVDAGVSLVLCGHAHCYERFDVDGVQYVVDGGGGAVLYDPNESAAQADAERPGESALRVAVSESRGATTIDIAPDGSLSVERRRPDGVVSDQFTV